jgi:anaerobic magnesium-protoporphyrin IX monomethyl ester cyclase
MKILFFYPNITLSGTPPSNLALLSSFLKNAGHETKLFDCSMYKEKNTITNDNKREKLGHVKKSDYEKKVNLIYKNIYIDFIETVNNYSPDLIAINLIDSTIDYSLKFLELIKDKNISVIAGGVAATFLYERILNSGLINFVCIGEGEEAIVELCEKLSKKEDCTNIKNIYTKNKMGKIKKNPLRPLIDLETLPIPDFSIYDYTRFYRPFMGDTVRMMVIDIDRGCPFQCSYCSAPQLRKKFKNEGCGIYYRKKSLNKIFEEIKYLIKKYDCNFIWFSSETMLAMPDKMFYEFSERYKAEVNLPFWCQNRLDKFTEEKTKTLYEMGCRAIAVGLEHGNEKIRQNLLKKNLTNKQILKAFKIISKYDIKIGVNNMICLPDETRENVFETIELNRKVSKILKGNHTLNVFTFIPFSGTELRDLCIEKEYITGKEDIPISFFTKSILNMPSMSKEEIYGLERTVVLYILLPKKYWPDIKIAEKEDKEGNNIYVKLMKIKNELYNL